MNEHRLTFIPRPYTMATYNEVGWAAFVCSCGESWDFKLPVRGDDVAQWRRAVTAFDGHRKGGG